MGEIEPNAVAVVLPTTASPPNRPRRRAMLAVPLGPVLVVAALVSAGVVTLGAPLIPAIQAAFGVSGESATWSYTITLLVGAGVTPVLGRLSDGHHRRTAMTAVCGVVAAGCALSALADSFGLFLLGRAMQGLGAALVAMTIATARDHVSGTRGVRLVALLSVTTALGAGVSYPITTAVVQHFGLAAAFAGSALLILLVGVTVLVQMPSGVDPARPRGLDVPGALLLMIGSALGLLAISQGNHWGWLDVRILALGGVSVVMVAAWAVVELRVRMPLVELRLMRHRNVLAANVTALLMGVSLYSTPALVSRVALAPEASGYGAGLTLSVVGLIMTAIAVGNLVGSRLSAAIGGRFGPRFSLAAGGLVTAAGSLLLVLMPPEIEIWHLVVAILLTAFGAGATFGTMPNLIVASVAPEETGSATSLNILLRTVGGAIGSAATSAVLGAHAGLLDFPSQVGYQYAYVVCGGASLAAVLVSVVLPARISRTSKIVPSAEVPAV